jgi:type IV pilus assembly protein PilC
LHFSYKAIDSEGNLVQAECESDSRGEVLKQLKGEGLTILDIHGGPLDEQADANTQHFEPFGISASTLAFFTRQLAELTDAGIPMLESLASLQRFTPSAKFQQVIREISQSIRQGCGLYDSLAKHPDVFPKMYLGMIKAGETSGNFSGMLGRLADYLERDLDTRGKIRSALSYPVFVLVFSVVTVYAMVAYLLPGFEPIWQQSGLDLSHYPVTLVLMKISDMTHSFWDELLVVAICGPAIWGLYHMLRTSAGREAFDRFLLRAPLVSGFVQLTVTSRVAQTFGTLVEAGIPLVQSLELAGETAGNTIVQNALQTVQTRVREGGELADSLAATKVFPPLFVQMVGVGVESGSLSEMLVRTAKYYQRQLDSAVKSFSSLIEPAVMVVLGGMVLFFILGVFLPIMGIVGALQNQL